MNSIRTSLQAIQTSSAAREEETSKQESMKKRNAHGHGRFRETLIAKAEEFGKEVKVVGEAYTSKMCSRCGWIHHRLGGRKVLRMRTLQREKFSRALLDGAILL